MRPTIGSLFAGIGGFDLGFERAGFEVKWQVEIDPWCRRVLAKHWPDVKRHDDVKTFPPTDAEEWKVDCIIGGFPCQDISNQGKRAGISGERSGLWAEFSRTIGLLRPRFVVVENVWALVGRGISRVVGDLADSGYDAEWCPVPASIFGLAHRRKRIFIVANSRGLRQQGGHAVFAGRPPNDAELRRARETTYRGKTCRGNSGRVRLLPESDIWRVAARVPEWLDRLKGLGNAVVPQVAEWIGTQLMSALKG